MPSNARFPNVKKPTARCGGPTTDWEKTASAMNHLHVDAAAASDVAQSGGVDADEIDARLDERALDVVGPLRRKTLVVEGVAFGTCANWAMAAPDSAVYMLAAGVNFTPWKVNVRPGLPAGSFR